MSGDLLTLGVVAVLATVSTVNRLGSPNRGYKVVATRGEHYFSLADGSRIPAGTHAPAGGLYLGTSAQFVRDYYSGLVDEDVYDGEAVLVYEYDPADVLRGDPEEEGEVVVRRARLVDVRRGSASLSRRGSTTSEDVASLVVAHLSDQVNDKGRIYGFRGSEREWGFRLKKDARLHAIAYDVDPQRVIKVDRMYWKGYAVGAPESGARLRVLSFGGEWLDVELDLTFSRVHGALRAAIEQVDAGIYLHSTVGLGHDMREARKRGWVDEQGRPTVEGEAIYSFYELDRMTQSPIDVSSWRLVSTGPGESRQAVFYER